MKVLLPVASEKVHENVLSWLKGIAEKIELEIEVLNVQHSFEDMTLAYPSYPEFMVHIQETHDSTHNAKAQKIAEQTATKVATELTKTLKVKAQGLGRIGDPADSVITLIEEENYDLVIMKDRDRTEIGRFFLGSITDKVVHHSKSPVLIIK